MQYQAYEGLVTFDCVGYRTPMHNILFNDLALAMPELIEQSEGMLKLKEGAKALQLFDFITCLSRTRKIDFGAFDSETPPEVLDFQSWWLSAVRQGDYRAAFEEFLFLAEEVKQSWLDAVGAAINPRPIAPAGLRGEGENEDADPLVDGSLKKPSRSSAKPQAARSGDNSA